MTAYRKVSPTVRNGRSCPTLHQGNLDWVCFAITSTVLYRSSLPIYRQSSIVARNATSQLSNAGSPYRPWHSSQQWPTMRGEEEKSMKPILRKQIGALASRILCPSPVSDLRNAVTPGYHHCDNATKIFETCPRPAIRQIREVLEMRWGLIAGLGPPRTYREMQRHQAIGPLRDALAPALRCRDRCFFFLLFMSRAAGSPR